MICNDIFKPPTVGYVYLFCVFCWVQGGGLLLINKAFQDSIATPDFFPVNPHFLQRYQTTAYSTQGFFFLRLPGKLNWRITFLPENLRQGGLYINYFPVKDRDSFLSNPPEGLPQNEASLLRENPSIKKESA